MKILDTCRQIKDPESGRILLYRDELEAVLTAGDTISRQAAIDRILATGYADQIKDNLLLILRLLPPAQPEIIQCRNCKFASGDSRVCMKFGHSPIGELDFCAWAERRTDEA